METSIRRAYSLSVRLPKNEGAHGAIINMPLEFGALRGDISLTYESRDIRSNQKPDDTQVSKDQPQLAAPGTSVTGSSNVDHEAIDNDATQRKATKSVSTAEDERRPYRRIYDCKFVKKPGKYYWFKSTSLSHLASPPPFPEGYVQKVDLVYYNHVLSATEAHQFWWRAQHDPEWTPMVFGDTKVFYDETYYLSCTPSGAVSWVNLQTFKGKLRGMKKKIGE